METLEHGDYKEQYPEVLEELKPKFGNLEGVKVTVEENYEKEVVDLSIGLSSLVINLLYILTTALLKYFILHSPH